MYPLQQRTVLRAYNEFADLPVGRSLSVYSLEEITAEKVIALADSARNEPRDLYDLWHLTSREGIEIASVARAIQMKLEFRSRSYAGLTNAIHAKEARMKALWSVRLANQMSELPEFDEVFRALRRALRQAELP